MMQFRPYLSVVIPAYNEEAVISDCLQSISRQDYPHDLYEIILVDNSSTDRTSEIISRDFPHVHLVVEPRQGVVFARIRGIAEAHGEIIVCTDADSTVPVDWLSNFVRAYADPEVVAVGGVTRHQETSFLSRCLLLGMWVNYHVFHLMMGYNMSFRTSAYHACGGFDEKVGFGEDTYITQQLKKMGKVVVLHGNAVTTSLRRYRSKNWFNYVTKVLVASFYLLVLHRPSHINLTPVNGITGLKDPSEGKG